MESKGIILAILIFFIFPFGARAQVLVGGGTIRYDPKGAAPAVFNHEKHVEANGRRCSGCHFGVFQMEKGSYSMNMNMMTKGHFCGVCHNGKTAFDVEDHAQCKQCHQ